MTLAPPASAPVNLPYDLDGISRDDDRRDGDFDGAGRTISGDLLPATVVSAGIPFRTGPQGAGQANVVTCRGQQLALPPGAFDRVYLLAAAVGGDRQARFAVGDTPVTVTVPDWAEPVGQWNDRLVGGELVHDPAKIAPAYAKTVPLGWVGTHRHGARGENEAYVFTHVYRLRLDVPPGARTLTLPDDPRVRVLAVTAAANPNDAVVAAQPFTDPARGTVVHVVAPHRTFTDRLAVTLTSPNPGATIRYTLDGTEPTAASPAYTAPLVLDRTTTVKARAFAPGLDDRFVAAATFTRAEPRPGAEVAAKELAPGLACRLYEGEWRKLPDFATLTPAKTLTVATVGLPAEAPKENFGLVCTGYLAVPADGITRLALRAEDDGELWLDGERALTHDHIDYTRRPVELPLAAGLHPVEVRYYQRNFVAGLELLADTPTAALAPVPADRLFHRPEARP